MTSNLNPYIWSDIEFNKLFARKPSHGLTKPSSIRGEGFKMVNMGELFQYDRILNQEMEYVPCTDRELQEFKLNVGDILFARQSLVLEGVGKCSIVVDVPEPTVFESHIIRIRLQEKLADPQYYHYFFSSYYGKKLIQSIAIQVAASGIRSSELSKLKVPNPPINIQNNIAYIISNFDKLIEINSRKIEILEQVAQLLYREWFVEYRFPGYEKHKFVDSELGKIPEGWIESRVSDVLKIQRGISYGSDDLSDNGLPFITINSINRNGGYKSDGLKYYQGRYKESQLIKPGDIIIGVTDMTQARLIVGSVARIPTIGIQQGLISMDVVRAIPIMKFNNEYVYSLLRYSDFTRTVKEFANGANVLHLSPKHIESFQFVLPIEEVRQQFAQTISPIYQLMDNLSQQNALLVKQKDLLLPKLMSGEIDLSNLDIKTESN